MRLERAGIEMRGRKSGDPAPTAMRSCCSPCVGAGAEVVRLREARIAVDGFKISLGGRQNTDSQALARTPKLYILPDTVYIYRLFP